MKKEDFQEFFKLRMTEILHKDTLDSYRVKANNVMSLLIEFRGVLENWTLGNIKNYQTVSYCLEECTDLIKKDTCLDFSFYGKDLFIEEFSIYDKEQRADKNILVSATMKLKTYVEMCISINKTIYLERLLDKIRQQLFFEGTIDDTNFSPTLREFDAYVSSFACELLRKGFSKKYLYSFFKYFKQNKYRIPFREAFDKMCSTLVFGEKKRYTVVFKLNFPYDVSTDTTIADFPNLKASIDESMKNSIIKEIGYKEEGDRIRFYIMEIDALDSAMAARLCHDELSTIFDFNLNTFKSVEVPSTALTFCPKDGIEGYNVKLEKVFILDRGDMGMSEDEHSLYEKLKSIEQNPIISQDVKDRIIAAIRHLRIGDCQSEIEQQFINYWIALEFIFASSLSKESTFERIKKFFIEISQACYIKRNILYLNTWLIKTHRIQEDEYYWEKNDVNEFINSIDNILLKYRLLNMKSHLRNGESIKKYLAQHRKNLEQHITRIYRLRNELIHEAAIKQDIANVTSNLRSYLVFVLNQLIFYFNSSNYDMKSREMMQFFLTYESALKINSKYSDINKIIKTPLENNPIY